MVTGVVDLGPSVASRSCRPWALPNILDGFILSRQVEGYTAWTCRCYRSKLGVFIRYVEDNKPDITQITRMHIDSYLVHLQEIGRSPHTVNAHYRMLRTFFKWCVGEELIDRSPMRNIKTPKLPRTVKPFLTKDQRDILLKLCPQKTFLGARTSAVIWLLWGSGMRLAELANLKREDLAWDSGEIKVFGKGQRERLVVFTPRARRAVWRYLVYRHDNLPGLWITEERRTATISCIISSMRRTFDRSGLRGQTKDIHHIFRRTWAWRMIKAEVPLKYIKLAGGWKSTQVLMQYVEAIEETEAIAAILKADDNE